ncbi:uncharacterized protein LODBEIA_P23060 [Lodderomyces beijingensis]|uniref:Pre-mRNA-splicing factor CLF1 n=1 Tax=Lodderomyces beijingensis TaxID=1775926 RepID=A0ABP0ZIX2_9ASCO
MGDDGDQITNNQILDEAFNKGNGLAFARPKQTIQDLEELYSYQQAKRKEYEQQLNKNRLNFGQWIRYARWELEHNHDFTRVRSIMERALDVNVQHIPFWTQYVQWELIHSNVNHARNLLERAVTTLPNVNKLWFLYVQTEEMLKNYQAVRAVFERWMQWHPDESAWDAYIHFETRYEQKDNARLVFERYLGEYPRGEIWQKWIDYELQNNAADTAQLRAVFEAAVISLSRGKIEDASFASILASWLRWEMKHQELERVKELRKLILDESQFHYAPKIKLQVLNAVSEVDNILGDKDSIESGIIQKRRAKYEEDVETDPTNYGAWWSYINLMMMMMTMTTMTTSASSSGHEQVSEAMKRATSTPPLDQYKSEKWKQFILLWVRYALWEEFDNNDIESARKCWNNCLKLIPHKTFTSGKVWIGLAEFELRRDPENGLANARKVFGRALGQMNVSGPKKNILKRYIKLENTLCEWDRVRMIYQKWLELGLLFGLTCNEIVKRYFSFELALEEHARCEAVLDVVMNLWKNQDLASCFDQSEIVQLAVEYYTDTMQYHKVRDIYRDLVTKEPTVFNWTTLALFESMIPTTEQLERLLDDTGKEEEGKDEFEIDIGAEQIRNTRTVFEEAENFYRDCSDNEKRKEILESWKEYEDVNGDEQSVADVAKKLPKRVKRRRTVVDDVEEEYYELVFPDRETKPAPAAAAAAPSYNKFLANAKKWAESKNKS